MWTLSEKLILVYIYASGGGLAHDGYYSNFGKHVLCQNTNYLTFQG